MKFKLFATWICVVFSSAILGYNGYLKISANPGAVQLFSGLGLEPYGRVNLGILEILVGILVIIPKTIKYGAPLGTLLMTGVILIHLSTIGLALNGDYRFFLMGIVAFCSCMILTYFSSEDGQE